MDQPTLLEAFCQAIAVLAEKHRDVIKLARVDEPIMETRNGYNVTKQSYIKPGAAFSIFADLSDQVETEDGSYATHHTIELPHAFTTYPNLVLTPEAIKLNIVIDDEPPEFEAQTLSVPVPHRWTDMDGMLHVAGEDCCDGRRCQRCGGNLHRQPVYGGIAQTCEDCEDHAHYWKTDPLPPADEVGIIDYEAWNARGDRR